VLAFRDQRDEALAKYERALGLFEQVGDRLGQANVLQAQGDVLAFRDQRDEALAKYERALGLFEQVGSSLGQANVHLAQGDLLRGEEPPRSWQSYERAHALYLAIGDGYSVARALYRMGDWQMAQGDPQAAVPLYEAAIALWQAAQLPELAEEIIAPRLAQAQAALNQE